MGFLLRSDCRSILQSGAGLGATVPVSLLAPFALAWMPLGAVAVEWPAAELRRYGSSAEQVSSIQQFSDVRPTDWAYQALAALIERHGCVAGHSRWHLAGNAGAEPP